MSALIICAGGNENFSFAKGVGIGLIEASLGTWQLCWEALNSKQEFEQIIFIGTCGLYDEKDELLQIYESSHCFNLEYSKLCANFYSPISNEIRLNVSQETYKSNSSNYICADKKAALKFKEFGLRLENMELFAILKVADKFKIPATSYLCATNFCDEKAHENFVKNHSLAKKKLEEFLQDKNLI
ncbi:purine-nucleoside phosphorylase [Campylobacter sp. MIT 99-7217]|uniref:phosphorylase family protein n=1 Tax=Campylobacter sp. MIT 99-7217 TaxID=535091 RepID=UPI00115A27D3|nr:purine-nucleoside phosphorylase [Campylobacter sp. MIT 99-7217]TQR31378.1 purine-nucleoside phosphorylase [Campylobacter sp. MIT 99-7217]